VEDDKPKELVLFPLKGSYSKAKITPVYIMNPFCYRAKVDVPAEVSSQIEAVNEGNQ
jgi:hypothetical protein